MRQGCFFAYQPLPSGAIMFLEAFQRCHAVAKKQEQCEDKMDVEQDTAGIESEILAETDNLIAWRSQDDSGYVYHLELGTLSLHLMPEEWDELIILLESAATH
jgi:hypothetical protein